MRHRKAGVKLGRNSSHRKAMFRNMVTSLFKYDRIRTTDAKAKELRSWADHIVTLAKRGDLHARRQALSIIREQAVVHRLFDEAGTRFGDINGGYTRVIKVGRRPGDAAAMSMIELVAADKSTRPKRTKRVASETTETSMAAPAASSAAMPAAAPEIHVAPAAEAALASSEASIETEDDVRAGTDGSSAPEAAEAASPEATGTSEPETPEPETSGQDDSTAEIKTEDQ